jgi:uncharacterized membrane protein
MRWLRKAVFRGAGIIPLHDENDVFRSEAANLALLRVARRHGVDPAATAMAFKAVLLEGVEVAFIVLAVAAGGPSLLPASLAGAVAAAALVILSAAAVRRPLPACPGSGLLATSLLGVRMAVQPARARSRNVR